MTVGLAFDIFGFTFFDIVTAVQWKTAIVLMKLEKKLQFEKYS